MNPRRIGMVALVFCLLLPVVAHAFVAGVEFAPAAPAQVTITSRTADRLELRVDVPELQWARLDAEGVLWDVVAVEDLGWTSDVGRPLLPVYTRLVEVDATEGIAVRLLEADAETFHDVNLLPAQPPVDRNATTLPPFEIDDAAYASGAVFPVSPVTTGKPVIIHGRRFVPVHFYPLSYNPAAAELRVLRSAALSIEGGQRDGRNPLMRSLPPSTVFSPIVNDLALQFDRKGVQDNWATQDGTLLVVVYDEFADIMSPYVDWKRKKGLPVEVHMVSELPGAGQDPQLLKQFFYQRYNNPDLPPLDYILLVGDNQHIKTMVGLYGCAADSKYVTLDGDDYFPDVIIGRFPAGNRRQIANSVQKSIAYEMTPAVDTPAWFRRGLVMSGSDSVDDQNATFVGEILENEGGFGHVDYLFTSRHNFSADVITEKINLGRSWVSYFGHGSASNWSSPFPAFTNNDVVALNNQGMLPVITDIACDNAHFDAAAECFAEVWIESNADAGAAGIFAASRNTPFGYTDKLGRGVAVGHFRQNYLTFGAAAYFGKIYMYHFYPEQAGRTTEEVMQHYLIFGDPELNVWSDTPKPLGVEYLAEIEVDAKDTLTFTVTLQDAPLAAALVHVWRDEEIDLAGRTDAQGVADFILDEPLTEGTLQVMVTGRNGLPYEGVIEVVPAASADDDDTPGGDDDDDTPGGLDDDDTGSGDDDTGDDDDDATDDDKGGGDDDDNSGGCGG
ncbi:MAG: C25 family cysteine peptidase [Candidatus Lernaella stagnicola]|nr:C25 family cysteine peptidase [Candidatus Lernaella stagnicola]